MEVVKMEYDYNRFISEQYYLGIADPTARAEARAHDEKYFNVCIEIDCDIRGVSSKQAAYAKRLLEYKLNHMIRGAIESLERIADRERRLDDAFKKVGVDNFSDLIEYTVLNQRVAGVPMSDILEMDAHDIIEKLQY